MFLLSGFLICHAVGWYIEWKNQTSFINITVNEISNEEPLPWKYFWYTARIFNEYIFWSDLTIWLTRREIVLEIWWLWNLNIFISDYDALKGTLRPWSYGSWIYNYLCDQFISPMMLRARIAIRARCTRWCDKVCQWLVPGWWFSSGSPVFSTNKTDWRDIAEILLKVALSTTKQTNKHIIHLMSPESKDTRLQSTQVLDKS